MFDTEAVYDVFEGSAWTLQEYHKRATLLSSLC